MLCQSVYHRPLRKTGNGTARTRLNADCVKRQIITINRNEKDRHLWTHKNRWPKQRRRTAFAKMATDESRRYC